MEDKKKSRRKIILILIISFLFITGSLVFFIYRFPQIKYYTKNILRQLSKKEYPKNAGSIDTIEVSIEDLKNAENVTFDQSMLLINKDHLLSDEFTAEVGEYYTSGVYMNTCIMASYETLAKEVFSRYEEKLYIRSAFRTAEEQQKEIDERGEIATAIGASEHQAGLALDVYVPYHAGAAFLQSDAGIWVNESCDLCGFIIRYPSYGKEKTGISFEPWHLRYVGFPHANIIMKNQITLEEYLDLFKPDQFYVYKDYCISRQTISEKIILPKDYTSAVISEDGCGYYFVTATLLFTDIQ